MCGIRYPKAGEPSSHGVIDVFQEGQHHSALVAMKEQKRVVDISVVHTNIIKVIQQHFFEESDHDGGFGKVVKTSGNSSALKTKQNKTGKSTFNYYF
jgi:hypothetical protein